MIYFLWFANKKKNTQNKQTNMQSIIYICFIESIVFNFHFAFVFVTDCNVKVKHTRYYSSVFCINKLIKCINIPNNIQENPYGKWLCLKLKQWEIYHIQTLKQAPCYYSLEIILNALLTGFLHHSCTLVVIVSVVASTCKWHH